MIQILLISDYPAVAQNQGLTRTPIIQRNSDRGGKEKAHLVGTALLSTPFFLHTFVTRGTDKEGATAFRRKA